MLAANAGRPDTLIVRSHPYITSTVIKSIRSLLSSFQSVASYPSLKEGLGTRLSKVYPLYLCGIMRRRNATGNQSV